jgi:TIR domain
MPNEVFLSYSHDADERLINELKNFFSARHINAFSYKHDERGHGDLLDARIEDAIRSCARIFFVITDGALASRWVTLEMALAERHEKHSVAVAYHGLDLKRVPAYLTKRKAIVYTDYKSALDQLSTMDWGINVYIPAFGYGGREFSANFPKAFIR